MRQRTPQALWSNAYARIGRISITSPYWRLSAFIERWLFQPAAKALPASLVPVTVLRDALIVPSTTLASARPAETKNEFKGEASE